MPARDDSDVASAKASALNLGVHADDRWLAALPLCHVGGLSILLRSVLDGMTALVHESFDPARANAAIDNDGIITSLNLSFERITGHKCAAWIGKSCLPLLEQKDAANFLVHFRGKTNLETAPLFQINLLDATGKPVPVEVSVSPLKRDTETVGAVGIIRDVSHRAPA